MDKDQRMMRAARQRIAQGQLAWEAAGFADAFPALLETHGLAQSVALAKARGNRRYLDDLAFVLAAAANAKVASAESLDRAIRELSVTEYVHLSCNTLRAATCLKQSVTEAIACQSAPAMASSRATGPSRAT